MPAVRFQLPKTVRLGLLAVLHRVLDTVESTRQLNLRGRFSILVTVLGTFHGTFCQRLDRPPNAFGLADRFVDRLGDILGLLVGHTGASLKMIGDGAAEIAHHAADHKTHGTQDRPANRTTHGDGGDGGDPGSVQALDFFRGAFLGVHSDLHAFGYGADSAHRGHARGGRGKKSLSKLTTKFALGRAGLNRILGRLPRVGRFALRGWLEGFLSRLDGLFFGRPLT